MQSKQIINVKRIFIIPLILTVFLSFIFGYLIYSIAISSFREHQIEDGVKLTEMLASNVSKDMAHHDFLIKSIEDSLISTGEMVIEHRELLSDDYLSRLIEITEADQIYVYNVDGVVTHDSSGENIGLTLTDGNPAYTFMVSGLDVLIEKDIWPSSEDEGQLYKYIYLRDSDGSFVQVGVNTDYIVQQTHEYYYQNIVNNLVKDHKDLLYGLILNLDLVAVADSDLKDINVSYAGDEAYLNVLTGKTVSEDWYYPKIDQKVLEVATPLYHDGEIIGIVAIGFSLDFNLARLYIITVFSALSLAIITTFVLLQFFQIVRPLHRLNKVIIELDVESGHNDFNTKKQDVLSGIYGALNNMMTRIHETNRKNQVLNSKIKELAYTDHLTNIPNRMAFIEKIKETHPDHDNKFAILFLDLDGFKSYNDIKGHTFGDNLLVVVTAKLKLLDSTKMFLARYGGDEFLMRYSYDDMDDLNNFIKQIRSIFDEPFDVNQALYPLDVSIGISLFPIDDTSIEQLIRKADVAMYHSKSRGKNKVNFFDPSMDKSLNDDTNVTNIIKLAIKNDGFDVVYQPQVNIHTNKIVSLEALVRIKDENIPPSIFIPLAEKGGLISQIGRIVLSKVIKQQATWKRQGLRLLPVYVNFSSYQIDDSGLVEFILTQLKVNDVPPEFLGLELTESAIIERDDEAQAFLEKLTKIGIKTALDDFGSGQAGINYLTKYRVNTVKLDKSFSDNYLCKEKLVVFNSVVNLIELLGFSMIIEGIETKEQIDILKTTNCHLVQGYFYYKPTSSDLVFKLLQQNETY